MELRLISKSRVQEAEKPPRKSSEKENTGTIHSYTEAQERLSNSPLRSLLHTKEGMVKLNAS